MTEYTKEALVDLICTRLQGSFDAAQAQFLTARQNGVGHFVVDNFLPEDITRAVYQAFPTDDSMRLMDTFRERKLTYKQLDNTDPLLKNITFAILR